MGGSHKLWEILHHSPLSLWESFKGTWVGGLRGKKTREEKEMMTECGGVRRGRCRGEENCPGDLKLWTCLEYESSQLRGGGQPIGTCLEYFPGQVLLKMR